MQKLLFKYRLDAFPAGVCLLILKLVVWGENDCEPFFKRNSIITISLKCCPRFLPHIVSRLNCTLHLSSFPCTEIVEIGVDLISYVCIGTLVMILLESENICICLLSCWRWKCSVRVGPVTQSWPELVRHIRYLSMISWLVSSMVSKSKWSKAVATSLTHFWFYMYCFWCTAT